MAYYTGTTGDKKDVRDEAFTDDFRRGALQCFNERGSTITGTASFKFGIYLNYVNVDLNVSFA